MILQYNTFYIIQFKSLRIFHLVYVLKGNNFILLIMKIK